ncbi:MAG: CBU_0592 family membrane protein [Pseudomonadota bacterium]|uniref:CBU-0592-like domain-containing protein n=1 Tax=Sphingobium xenophagum TaxID=121428 RepID=A0A249MV07_SPHXE|nr:MULTISPECIES: hypothetical protein [Sphingobium]MBU2016775.1 hypothetical protein [Alphaproteobacteria bacterium]ASY45122.1 hypothetical protein CJD35_12235 [Sphingobium xenophagum]MBG6116488.1 hypothetical protein [Sphingobium sp. JAI105]OUC54306.1 hypothetical protein CA262_05085 [Sphingobium sp. GW456-12-10-14-TSB1]PSO10794.1 hypothetical protein C7E20_15025 [Sphingobium sp. AEW4]|tara:strand:+ start:103 stop:354 length:252 start_codon:yes stop_codon:yes gene_type:complete
MTMDWANIVGLLGSGLMVVAYAYSNIARELNFLWFNLLNLVGSLLLIASLTIHFNLASMALEIVWAAIAVIGLANTIRKGNAR